MGGSEGVGGLDLVGKAWSRTGSQVGERGRESDINALGVGAGDPIVYKVSLCLDQHGRFTHLLGGGVGGSG